MPLPTADPLPLRRREPRAWTPSEAQLVAWFEARGHDTPAAPFALGRSVVVADRSAFLAALRRDVQAGPNGCRADALGQDLAALRAAVEQRRAS